MNQHCTRILLALAALACLACDPRDPCDPGYFADHGACYPNPTDASVSMDGSAGDGATRSYTGFGRSCKTSDDCLPDAPVCAAPGLPICTAVNCMDDPLTCPPGWSCIDVSQYSDDPALQSACVKF